MKTYRINEIFHSLQGEGMRAGTVNVFIRFSGCNLACDILPGPKSPGGFRCDTEFVSGRDMTGAEIVARIRELMPSMPAVVLTGGEPLLQLDDELLDLLRAEGVYVAIETNGTYPRPKHVDWVSCSPKVAEHAMVLEHADELKYVRHYGQGLPKPRIKADSYLISPAWGDDGLDQGTLRWCIDLCKSNPVWRLSVQQHKIWRVR